MIRFRTLGVIDLCTEEGSELRTVLRQPKRVAFLAYLAAATPRGFQRRDTLVALFWPELDDAHARGALRQAVRFLRRHLGENALIGRGEEELALGDGVWCDAVAFERAALESRAEEALELYRGDFLPGFFVSDAAPEFDQWIEAQRARLRIVAAKTAWLLAGTEELEGSPRGAAHWARRAMALAPHDESALRQLVSLLDKLGDRAGALKVYEDFARDLAKEYDAEPAAETQVLVEAVRARVNASSRSDVGTAHRFGAAARFTQARAAPLAARASRRISLPRTAWATGVLLAALASATLFWRTTTRPVLDPNLIAVAPFDVLDPKFGLWHEGLVDYLSRNLDGAGPLRTVSPTVVLRRWKGRADPASARELGRRTGAELVVFGQVIRAGSDSVRLRLAILDATSGRVLVARERRDLADRMDRLADSLTTDVLRGLGRVGAQAHIRLAATATTSLAALKAFLRGEQFLRRFSLDSALQVYEEAVEDDSTFALALRRIGLVRGWRGQGGGPLGLKAGAFNHGLAPRDSLLIVADSLEAAADDMRDSAYWSHRVRKFVTLEQASRRYPDDPEVWYTLGEAHFHLGYVVGSTAQQAMDAFDRAIALDTGFAPAYFHPVQLALDRNDTAAAKRYINGYLSLTSNVPEGAGLRIVGQLLDQRHAKSPELQSALDVASANALFDAWRSVQRWPDSNEAGVRLLRVLATSRPGAGLSAATEWTRHLLTTELLYRGHLREASALVGSRLSQPLAELAMLGALSADSASLAFHRWLESPIEREVTADPPWVTRCYRSFLAAGWWARRGDTVPLFRLMRRGDSVARSARSLLERADARADASLAHAALAMARRDTAEALRRFLAFPDSLCARLYGSLSPSLAPLHMVRFQLLAATGRDREAALVFDQEVTTPLTVSSVVATLERGRIAERLGDRSVATRMYEFVIAVWRNADPELQPYVIEARAALRRLGR